MAFTENLSVFFADFGQTATWTPRAGGAQQTATVLLDEPDQFIVGQGEVITTKYMMTYRATDFQGFDYKEQVMINGNTYQCISVLKITDGVIMTAQLEKI